MYAIKELVPLDLQESLDNLDAQLVDTQKAAIRVVNLSRKHERAFEGNYRHEYDAIIRDAEQVLKTTSLSRNRLIQSIRHRLNTIYQTRVVERCKDRPRGYITGFQAMHKYDLTADDVLHLQRAGMRRYTCDNTKLFRQSDITKAVLKLESNKRTKNAA